MRILVFPRERDSKEKVQRRKEKSETKRERLDAEVVEYSSNGPWSADVLPLSLGRLLHGT
jgi:hypothetical protein